MAEKVKVIILVDNEAGQGLKNDWGFSAYIESNKWKILFDADTNPKVLEYNCKKLGIDLSKIDFAVLSHWHHDHYGGLTYVEKVAKGKKLYVPMEKVMDFDFEIIPIKKSTKILEDVWIIGPLPFSIAYEQALAIEIKGKLIVFVGCSHPGADSLAYEAKNFVKKDILWVVGGYHLPSYRVLDNLAKISEFISPAHCSGDEAKKYVRAKYPEKYLEAKTGSIFEF